MKIQKIHIYGFGKCVDQVWELGDENFSLFFGDNESGKSTLMAFIQAIFFGFPSKRENQFIPRGTKDYGGSITVVDSSNESVFIERVANHRQRGKVTVNFANGRSGDERDLDKLLQGMDAASFKGIFHFGLDGLQGIKDLNPEKLNRYLYHAGMAGGTKLSILEKQMEQERIQLFKPRGKKTELNKLALQISEKERMIKEWEDRLDHYEKLKQTVDQANRRLEDITEKQDFIQKQYRWIDKRISLSPIVREWYVLKQENTSSASNDLDFPQDGLKRLDLLKERKQDKEARIQNETEIIENLKRDKQHMSAYSISEEALQNIDHILEQASFYEKLKQDKKQLEIDITEHLNQQSEIEREWGLLDDDVFKSANIHTYIFEKYENIKQKWFLLRSKRERLVEESKKQKKDEQLTLKQLEHEKQWKLSDDEEANLKEKLEDSQGVHLLQKEKALKQEQIKWLNEEKKQAIQNEKTKNKWWSVAAGLALIAGFLIFTIDRNISYFLFLVSICSWMYIFIKKQNFKVGLDRYINPVNRLKQEITSLEEKQKRHSAIDQQHINQLLQQQQDRKHQISLNGQKLTLLEQQKNEWNNDWSSLETESEDLDHEITKWSTDAFLPKGKDVLFYEGFLKAVSQWKHLDKQINHLDKKKRAILTSIEIYQDEVRSAVQTFENGPVSEFTTERLKQLQRLVYTEKSNKEKSRRLKEKLDAHLDIRIQTEQELEQIDKQLKILFELANVEEEEAFRKKAADSQKVKKQKERLEASWHQIMSMIPEGKTRKQIIDEIINGEDEEDHLKESMKQELTGMEREKSLLHMKIAEAKNERSQLEEEGTYDEQRQLFTSLKAQLNDYVKEWAVLQTSQYIIDKVKQIYEKERQPEVIRKSQEIFSELTSYKYPYLFTPLGEERFLVERADGQRFDPANLSRGTCELLYLAIRLGLAIKEPSRSSFPLFLDEALVNMDLKRRANVMKLLESLAKKRQIIFFTCHEHFVEEVTKSRRHNFSIYTLT